MWVFEEQPGSAEWEILEEACAELDKLWQLVQDKIEVGGVGGGGMVCPVCVFAWWMGGCMGGVETNKQGFL